MRHNAISLVRAWYASAMTSPRTMWGSMASLALMFALSCDASHVPVEPLRIPDAGSTEVTAGNEDTTNRQGPDVDPNDALTIADTYPVEVTPDSTPDDAVEDINPIFDTHSDGTPGADATADTTSTTTDTAEDTSSDTAEQSPCPMVSQVNDFELVLHRLNAEGQLGPQLSPMEAIEIVQGPQGGVHIEFGYHAAYPANMAPKVFAAFEGKTFMNASEPPVGIGGTPLTVLFLSPTSDGYDSQLNLVIFEQNEAVHYEEQPCCAVATVSILEPSTKDIVATSTAAIELYCEDIF